MQQLEQHNLEQERVIQAAIQHKTTLILPQIIPLIQIIAQEVQLGILVAALEILAQEAQLAILEVARQIIQVVLLGILVAALEILAQEALIVYFPEIHRL